jgi:NDP-hexose-3-ketoreductase
VPGPRSGRVFAGYEEALATIEPGLVYISLPNAHHYDWCVRALSAGFHVIVDKPALMNAQEAREVADIALTKRLCCAEASVWQFHPMIELLRRLKRSEGRRPLAASAFFTSPALENGNFRLDPGLGGGIIYDRATYAITCGRVVFDDEPHVVTCTVTERDPQSGVDLSCRIMLHYAGGGSLDAFFSLNADYRNTLSVVSGTYGVDFERIFTPPDDYEGPAVVREKGKVEKVATPRGSAFGIFLDRIMAAIESQEHEEFAHRMVEDAVIMDLIRDSAKGAMR